MQGYQQHVVYKKLKKQFNLAAHFFISSELILEMFGLGLQLLLLWVILATF
jgi:hypothetical protein